MFIELSNQFLEFILLNKKINFLCFLSGFYIFTFFLYVLISQSPVPNSQNNSDAGPQHFVQPSLLSGALQEDSLVPWETVYEKLNRMRGLLSYTPAMPLLLRYLRQLVGQRYARLGWSDTGSHLDKLGRNSILELACKVQYTHCYRSPEFAVEQKKIINSQVKIGLYIQNGNFLIIRISFF